MKLLSLTAKDRGDGLEIAVTYVHEGKLPNKAARRKFLLEALGKACEQVEKGEAVDVGFAEDDRQKMRRDHYLIPKT